MMTSLALEGGKKLVKDLPAGRFKAFLSGKRNMLWLDLNNPGNDELELLASIFNFHPLSIEDARKPQTLPKIDEFRRYIFIVFHRIEYNPKKGKIEPREIDIFLGRNFIVSVHTNSSHGMEDVMNEMRNKPHIMAKGPDIVLHRIIDYFIERYFPILAYFDREIDELEGKILRGSTGNTQAILKKMMRLRSEILKIKQSIDPQRAVITRLSKRETPFISERGGIYFRGVEDNILRFYTELEMYRDLIASAFEAYLSMVSNRMTEASVRMNEVMKTLTVIATIFLPLTFITGLYGMNFRVMPELFWDYSYYFALLGMLIAAVLMYVFFRRKGWA